VIRQCCQCKNVWSPLLCAWIPIDKDILDALQEPVTSCYCESCHARVMEEIVEEKQVVA
jgi:hypothetical protein